MVYFATDQWKYEESNVASLTSPLAQHVKHQHPADYNVTAARLGWLPSYPQFNKTAYSLEKRRKKLAMRQTKQLLNVQLMP